MTEAGLPFPPADCSTKRTAHCSEIAEVAVDFSIEHGTTVGSREPNRAQVVARAVVELEVSSIAVCRQNQLAK